MTDSAQRFRIRLGVALLLGYYAFQTILVAKQDEPYPGLMMPRFSWAGPEQIDGFDAKEADFVFSYADGVTRTISLGDVLRAVPEGHRYTMMESLFTPLDSSTFVARAPWGKLTPPPSVFPGYGLGRGSRREPAHRRSLANWLAQRARAFYAAAKPTLSTVVWYQSKYRTNQAGNPTRVSRDPSGRFEIDLHDVSSENR